MASTAEKTVLYEQVFFFNETATTEIYTHVCVWDLELILDLSNPC